MIKKVLTLILFICFSFASILQQKQFNDAAVKISPIYKQCDSSWKNDIMGTKTICSVGCLISSVAMALTQKGHVYNPGTLNKWLKSHGGYSGNLLIWSKINQLGFTYEGKIQRNQVKNNLNKGKVVILNVKNGAHWVLAKSYSGDTIYVKDPASNAKSSYALSQVKQAAIYKS